MYATNQRVLAGMGRHRRGVRGLGDTASTGGAIAGTAVLGPGVGTAVGGAVGTIVGSLFGGHHYTGPPVQAGFLNWAQTQAGRDILTQIATTGHGPHWSEPDKYPNGITYGGTIAANSAAPGAPPTTMSTQQFAAWLVAQYQGMAPSTTSQVTIPQNAGVGITQPVTVNIPAGVSRTGSVTTIAAEVTAVMTHVAQGQSLAQAIQTAINLGELNAGDAAAVQGVAGQVQTGKTTTTYSTASMASLLSNPLVLVGGAAVLLLLAKRH